MLKRRHLLMAGAGGLALLAAMRYRMPSSEAADERFPVSHTDAEWRSLLTPAPYAALPRAATQTPHSSPPAHHQPPPTLSCPRRPRALVLSRSKFANHTCF